VPVPPPAAASSSSSVDDLPPWEDDDVKEAGPAPMGPPAESLDLFGLDAGVADAARAAVAVPPSNRSPLASTAFAVGPSAQAQRNPDNEATRTLTKEDLFPVQDAHVVVGSDAVGDDATLAVAPGLNQASSQRFAAFAQTMVQDAEGGVPQSPGVSPPQAIQPPGYGAPPPSWQEPQQWSASSQTSSPMNPHLPPSNPHMPASAPIGAAGMGAPIGAPMQSPMQGPTSYPGHYAGPMQPGQPWAPPVQQQAQGGTGFKLSGQVLWLVVAGVVCVAIFITGIILFATTKF
jgi:hypothetical protein